MTAADALYDNDRREAGGSSTRTGSVCLRLLTARPAIIRPAGKWCDSAVKPAYFIEDVINVYYVQLLSPPQGGPQPRGIHCREVDWNVIYMSVDMHHNTTLAHELGHAFGLEHSGEGNACGSNAGRGVPLGQPDVERLYRGHLLSSLPHQREEHTLVRNGIRKANPKRECRFSTTRGTSDGENYTCHNPA
jgi:hypothetical protein